MFERGMKELTVWDVALIKLCVASFVLGIIALSPTITSWVQSVNPGYFVAAVVVFAIRPVYRFFFKGEYHRHAVI